MPAVDRRINRPCRLVTPGMRVKDPRSGSWEAQDGAPREALWEVQQRETREVRDGATVSITSWLALFRAGTTVTARDRVLCDDAEWSVEGDPWEVRHPRTGMATHVQASVRRVS